jgi:hypothetical protein
MFEGLIQKKLGIPNLIEIEYLIEFDKTLTRLHSFNLVGF